MARKTFEDVWADKVEQVRNSAFWCQVSAPPGGRVAPAVKAAERGAVVVEAGWALVGDGAFEADGPARIGMADLRRSVQARFGVKLRSAAPPDGPCIRFELRPGRASRWGEGFELRVEPGRIVVRGRSEPALLQGSLFLSNFWSLRRRPSLMPGRRRVRPLVSMHLGSDLWGGFCTTQAWVHGRETDENFLELARMGVNGMPVMTLLEDYLQPDPEGPFRSLANPQAAANRARLATLARQSARFGVHIFLMAYNPKLPLDHPVFSEHPGCRGAVQAGGKFRTLCSSDPVTRRFLAEAWASLFSEIPELGGLLAITGGEGFYHCFMRSRGAQGCPRCSRRKGPEVVAELVNAVARSIRAANPEARLSTWPYSAGHWSGDRDQAAFIDGLDPEHVVFQTEIDKDSVDWRAAGYAKNIWDYSMSRVTVSERCRNQRRQCRSRRLPFSVKIECNNSIECLSAPYLPALENQRAIWENARRLRPASIHSRWLFDGSCKSPSEEMGFWAIWGRGTAFEDLDRTLEAIAERDFGVQAAPFVRRAWRYFSEALRHHPQLDYYVGSYFVGAGQPLVLDPEALEELDPAFFGQFYWLWEDSATDDETVFTQRKPLFYARPGFRAIARRGPNRGRDVALEELQAMAGLWERGAAELEKAKARVPGACRARFRQERTLGRHMGYTWRSAANVEEFLRLRDTVREFSRQSWVRSGHVRENLRDLDRMRKIAADELAIARADLALVRGVDFLNLGLRLDMGTACTEAILEAKIRQVDRLLKEDLPRWRETLQTW